MVLAPKDFKDEEYLISRQILEKEGIEVKVASLEAGEAKGVNGTVARIDLTVDNVEAKDFDAVLFVGGAGMVDLVKDERLLSLAQKFSAADKLVTAICIAPMILANAGLLKDKKATVWSGASEDMKNQGVRYSGAAVEVDGKFITANGPAAAKEFGEKLLETLR